MKKQIISLGKALTKTQQQQVTGGFADFTHEGSCQIYDPEVGWMSGYSVEDARWLYHNESRVTGYCCASC
ncbi:hypothetical protein HN014_08970 [Aquimarina sp. TRL1]|uniref:hypothetical protein n=1 Tax=Aquimarina sp. (strain TRL1) TaxID=2736252 RepID=UPI00158D6AFE|nr:hypothetical protein [Aquimarina sp. TRL1]QKX05042.1 hypothetical protein HN014_08970 [Aquimarina sp. TRL1]